MLLLICSLGTSEVIIKKWSLVKPGTTEIKDISNTVIKLKLYQFQSEMFVIALLQHND